ncbi:thiamine biosynthesis lipoprotein [Candidatus Electrothrix marina]|uniref:FAD:protein FMN transferase n=2 Tax=Candidatus Electrothrix marina TaxID=1859130 RepID=A0A3S3UDF2_9BACT|nr:thiamine biosynthesis lipoprotein [Candidatus Electrothrix marina]RWX51736.1 thiamine biosynthesis lipoprotein [Candidatus Electrothrix marina]
MNDNSINPRKGLTRRSFLHIAALAGLASTAGATRFFSFSPDTPSLLTVRKSFPLMGTQLNLTVYSQDRDQAEAAISAMISRMQGIEGKLSRHQQESEVATLNRTGSLDQPSQELRTVLELADTIHRQTAGAFDITVLPLLTLYQQQKEQLRSQPALIQSLVRNIGQEQLQLTSSQVRLDSKETAGNLGITLDGIGKGYIVDQGVATLKSFGFQQVLVEAGGDLLVSGSKPHGAPWRIGIRNPRPEIPRELLTVTGENMAVATSGDYFQPFSPDLLSHHIINPKTGFSPPELASCTITAPNAALADALATGCMVLGKADSVDLLAGMPGCEGLFIGKNLKVQKTDGFAS